MPNMRLQRLFNRNERAVIVAMDHCLFDGPTEGMINLTETARESSALCRWHSAFAGDASLLPGRLQLQGRSHGCRASELEHDLLFQMEL